MATEQTKHTPTPWRTTKAQPNVICNEGGNKWIARALIGDKSPRHIRDAAVAEANAEFIVKAVNSHTALVEALEKAQKALAHLIDPNVIPTASVTHAYAQVVEAELCARRALSAEGEKDAPKDDGWIEWKGGERPVSGTGIRIECRLRDGSTDIAPLPFWRWSDEGEPDDIVAYRVVKP